MMNNEGWYERGNDLKLAKRNTYLENLMLESIAIVASFQKAAI